MSAENDRDLIEKRATISRIPFDFNGDRKGRRTFDLLITN